MTKDQKVVAIQEIKDLLQDSKVIYVADLTGLNAAQTSDFRRQAFKNNITIKVVKNTLLEKAMEQIEGVDFSEMYNSFVGNTAIMVAETANAPAKLIQSFRKKATVPAVKAAYVQETIYVGDENLDTLVNIKSKEEMLGEIIGLLQSPIQRLVSALQNKAEGAAEETAAPAEEAPATEAVAEEGTETPSAE